MEKSLNKESSLDTLHCFGNLVLIKSDADSDGIYECRIYDADKLISAFNILPYTKTPTAYFFDWKVTEPGKGMGTRLFPMILAYLSSDYDRIKLQASSDNSAAMKIYLANNLEITESSEG